MKNIYLRIFGFVLMVWIFNPMHSGLADNSQSVPPFYVRLNQNYKYPNTDLVLTVGRIEYALKEEFGFYIIQTPADTTVKIPKNIVSRVSDRDAANGLIAERSLHISNMNQLFADGMKHIRRLQAKCQELKMERDEMSKTIQSLKIKHQEQVEGYNTKRPTQYNGRPLPPNWIDPEQADANFFRRRQKAELRRMQSEIHRLNQEINRQKNHPSN